MSSSTRSLESVRVTCLLYLDDVDQAQLSDHIQGMTKFRRAEFLREIMAMGWRQYRKEKAIDDGFRGMVEGSAEAPSRGRPKKSHTPATSPAPSQSRSGGGSAAEDVSPENSTPYGSNVAPQRHEEVAPSSPPPERTDDRPPQASGKGDQGDGSKGASKEDLPASNGEERGGAPVQGADDEEEDLNPFSGI